MAKRKRYDDVMLLAAGEEVPGHLNRYVIERMVGTGAYGAVYAAHDVRTPDRKVALKEFFPARHPRDQAPLQALFDREKAVGMQASSHPLMPTFYEAFQSDGHYYIAQEFVVGTTLDEIIARRHPIARAWVLKWSVSLCDALAFLHSRQIVHHDLKPANIRITPQGHLVLLDFGAAQYFGKGHESDKPAELYGTEGYLPPELEADGKWVADIRTDIFALGCVLYEMVAGIAPDQEQINQRSMYVTNSLIQQPNADLNLVRLINKAISYNTDYRYGTAGDFLEELRQIAPPVLLVNKKNLWFGELTPGRPAPPMTVTLYNAGGGEITGTILSRTAWLSVSETRFAGNSHQVTVTVDPARAPEKGRPLTGRLDITSDDQTDTTGTVFTGDKWSVECSLTVAAAPGVLQIENAGTALSVSARRGQEALGQLILRNDGDLPLDFQVEVSGGIDGLMLFPTAGTLPPKQPQTLTVTVPPTDLPPGEYHADIILRSPPRQTVTVPVTLRVQSSLGYMISRLSRA